jgi:two-component system NtrC family response regulator/two-component system nitrogen regulation response regulator GlnG
MGEILIVDDDGQLRSSFEKLLTAEGHRVRAASSGEAGLEAVRESIPDLVVMDVRMPGMDGLEAFEAMHRIEPRLPVIIMTAYGSTDTAIQATKLGAYDYILKPFDIPDVLELIGQALEAGRVMRTKVALTADPEEEDEGEALIGQSRAMNEVYKAIGRVAGTDALVLIRGESGTGKELVARAIFQHSQRANRPFLIINCVAIPDTLLESELFGYEKGAFTGAVQRRVGKIEQANHGAVFLDEIGDMPVNIQAKILRLLQEKKIERLGGRETIDVDVRIIAATNRDLEAAVTEGVFREDLYYRLKVVTLNIPPLRDRKEDIPQLANYFLRRFAREMDMDNPGLTKEAVEALMEYNWPGNVRELANALQKALVFSRGGALGGTDVLKAVGDFGNGASPPSPYGAEGPLKEWVRSCLAAPGDSAFDACMDHVGRLVIREALEITQGNRTRAAKLLGLSRPTLLAKIEKYGLRIKAQIS